MIERDNVRTRRAARMGQVLGVAGLLAGAGLSPQK